MEKILFKSALKSPQLLAISNQIIRTQYAYKSVAASALKYFTAKTGLLLYRNFKKTKNLILNKKPKYIEESFPKDTVILYQFPRNPRAPSISPFALKLETWLRMSNIKYINKLYGQVSSRGKIPWIRLNDYLVEDSQLAVEYLSKVYNVDHNANLTDEQKGLSRAILKMTEESLIWCLAYHRFWYSTKTKELALPRVAYWLMGFKVYVAANCQGYGRFTIDEFYEIGKKDLKALNNIIGNKKFLFNNDKPCDTDAIVFGMCTQFIYCDLGPLNHFIKTECPNLVRYVENMKSLYWKDWDTNLAKPKSSLLKRN